MKGRKTSQKDLSSIKLDIWHASLRFAATLTDKYKSDQASKAINHFLKNEISLTILISMANLFLSIKEGNLEDDRKILPTFFKGKLSGENDSELWDELVEQLEYAIEIILNQQTLFNEIQIQTFLNNLSETERMNLQKYFPKLIDFLEGVKRNVSSDQYSIVYSTNNTNEDTTNLFEDENKKNDSNICSDWGMIPNWTLRKR